MARGDKCAFPPAQRSTPVSLYEEEDNDEQQLLDVVVFVGAGSVGTLLFAVAVLLLRFLMRYLPKTSTARQKSSTDVEMQNLFPTTPSTALFADRELLNWCDAKRIQLPNFTRTELLVLEQQLMEKRPPAGAGWPRLSDPPRAGTEKIRQFCAATLDRFNVYYEHL